MQNEVFKPLSSLHWEKLMQSISQSGLCLISVHGNLHKEKYYRPKSN